MDDDAKEALGTRQRWYEILRVELHIKPISFSVLVKSIFAKQLLKGQSVTPWSDVKGSKAEISKSKLTRQIIIIIA